MGHLQDSSIFTKPLCAASAFAKGSTEGGGARHAMAVDDSTCVWTSRPTRPPHAFNTTEESSGQHTALSIIHCEGYFLCGTPCANALFVYGR